VLSLLQQYTIMRRNNAEVHLWKNLGVEKWKARIEAVKALDVAKLGGYLTRASGRPPQAPGKSPQQAEVKGAKGASPGTSQAAARAANEARRETMTREQALRTLGLKLDATEKEIDAALAKQPSSRDEGLNGSDHAIAARIDAARDILRGKESS
jgi:hypothetical protein